ncbi:transcription factor GTE9 isoform X2 [Brachypodium distachyon]|uniref:Bromo domain-containing protein n=1 Tax=Brachypodium distachyon TaxID=15368 RepID=A0A0Q3HNG6_BRADI|nr:transcription factor GTE9 isoform X2 [Brachypodium distachyon]KQJ94930.1 hypothetical protein BRADI_3g14160v3 [Brachypodium distachyon]|eukprot:XP_010234273.1 transcription factor GTE9 isoform X2 [Brachypodium distachyon]
MMGKTQKFSKGHPVGFVPDYRYGVETGGASKVPPVNPARTEAKRKCINLNTEEGGDAPGFNVPREVFELSRMSVSDRKDLEMKLRQELEQVRALQNRLFSRGALTSMNGATSSAPGGDFNGNKKDGKLKRSYSVQSGRGLMSSMAQPAVSSINYAPLFKKCQDLLRNLMRHRYGQTFSIPVDPVKLNIPDYFDIVKHPMDLGTIQKKLNSGSYPTPWEFAADVRLTFSNAILYNPHNNVVHQMAKTMSSHFEPRWKPIEKKLPRPEEEPSVVEPSIVEPSDKGAVEKNLIVNKVPSEKKPSNKGAYKKGSFQKEEAVANPVLQPKKRKASPLVQDAPVAPEVQMVQVVEDAPVAPAVQVPQVAEDAPVRPTDMEMMTDKQKVDLSVRLQSYGGFIPEHVVEFIRRHLNDDNDADEDELTIDMNALDDPTLFELQKLLDDYDRENPSGNPTKDEYHEVEFQNEYGLRDSSMHHEGNELVEEDIDIGGNDLPLLTYPPVVFESETADRSSKHSSSSSSSSESGSSSSDSSSSSGSDLDVKVPPPNIGAKENTLSVVSLDQENDSRNTLNITEQSTDPVLISADNEDENVSEKQVSPDKKYRAALLKSRFADTILKAREKALDQVAQKDPEKVQREREELERLQREERARLQAEAKAAEDARRRAEAVAAAEAAAEAKRQRELEREAARKALQQMEKTVEINEGSLFLKDFEMLGTVAGEQHPDLVGEMNPTHTPEGLGFQLGGNPLEQLGLYMKNDDEEDEEVGSAYEPTVDVEEGEID